MLLLFPPPPHLFKRALLGGFANSFSCDLQRKQGDLIGNVGCQYSDNFQPQEREIGKKISSNFNICLSLSAGLTVSYGYRNLGGR